ncbi:hypothetical protein [Breznakiella homolactica]|uniref:Uncharacterized protein n=1 Tax=Breznakiella homolactica TaxID=2798577 RepID=A0A7T8BC99_9SPIR|nr:hypothetical protein [Breznakiella homolactica]QQO10925.1 hypothetical protein JFL75_08410 [Breznakiella homolactica]
MKNYVLLFLSVFININIHAFNGTIKIEQNNKIKNSTGNFYSIEDGKFTLILSNLNQENIRIFVYHDDSMFEKYQYPIKCEDTVMFHPATALSNNTDENNEITLYINREMQHNNISSDRRIYEQNSALIKIANIADIDNKFDGKLYVTIFIDFNNNSIIEENEIQNIVIEIDKNKHQSILFKGKVYISTLGYWVRYTNPVMHGDTYFYAKITNVTERDKFFELFGQDYSNNSLGAARIREMDYSKYNVYVVFSPITRVLELYQPYHYNGEYNLIFDVIYNFASNKGVYVFARNYFVEKEKDIFKICINDLGRITELTALEYR